MGSSSRFLRWPRPTSSKMSNSGRPSAQAPRVSPVGEPGVQVIEQVDAAGVANGDGLLASAQAEGFEKVTLAGARFAGDDEVSLAANEVETGQLEDGALVKRGLKGPVEGFQRLALNEPTGLDAALDAGVALRSDFNPSRCSSSAFRARLVSLPRVHST